MGCSICLVWKMKFTTVLLAFVLFVSQAYAELEPVLAAVQANVTNESKVAVNETLLPDVIEALKDNVTVDEYEEEEEHVEEEEEEEEEEVELIEQSANETLKDNVTVEEPMEEEEQEEEQEEEEQEEEEELIEESDDDTDEL